jgi:hypothetical protein
MSAQLENVCGWGMGFRDLLNAAAMRWPAKRVVTKSVAGLKSASSARRNPLGESVNKQNYSACLTRGCGRIRSIAMEAGVMSVVLERAKAAGMRMTYSDATRSATSTISPLERTIHAGAL